MTPEELKAKGWLYDHDNPREMDFLLKEISMAGEEYFARRGEWDAADKALEEMKQRHGEALMQLREKINALKSELHDRIAVETNGGSRVY